jgi:hypothetical protein
MRSWWLVLTPDHIMQQHHRNQPCGQIFDEVLYPIPCLKTKFRSMNWTGEILLPFCWENTTLIWWLQLTSCIREWISFLPGHWLPTCHLLLKSPVVVVLKPSLLVLFERIRHLLNSSLHLGLAFDRLEYSNGNDVGALTGVDANTLFKDLRAISNLVEMFWAHLLPKLW